MQKEPVGIGRSLAVPPSHTTRRTGHVSGGLADRAEGGPGEAQCNIASRYDGGPGIRRNKLKAYKWYWLCLHNKEASETAKYNADIHLNAYLAVGVLSMKQIKYAESQAREWQPKPSLHLEGLPDY